MNVDGEGQHGHALHRGCHDHERRRSHPSPAWWWWMMSCRSKPPINIDQEILISTPIAVSPPPLPRCIMPRRRRPDPRRATILHPTTHRAPRPKRSRPPTASRAFGTPRQNRDTGAPAHILGRCALPGCPAPPQFKRADARYCTDAHRLKHWRARQRAARGNAPQSPIEQPTTPTR